MALDERRKWRRLERTLSVQLRVVGGAGGAQHALGTHLSPEGIFVQVSDPPPEGARVRVSIAGETGDSLPLDAEGVVINQLEPDDGNDKVGVGIELSQAGPAWHKLYRLLSAELGDPAPSA